MGAGEEVGRREDLDAVLLWPFASWLVIIAGWIGAGYHDAAVEQNDGFGVVEAGYGRVGHDRHTAVERLGRVVEHGVVVGVAAETEACHAVLGSVQDDIGSVWETSHARHDTSGWLGDVSEGWG